MILRLRYIHRFQDRHGHVRVYLRRAGWLIALPPEADPGFIGAYETALRAASPAPAARIIVGSLADLVQSYYRTPDYLQLGASTRATYQRLIARLVGQYGDMPVRLLQTVNVRAVIAALTATPAAANHTLRSLRALMRHAVELGWRQDDPTIGVRRLKERGQGAASWTEADIAQYEAHWPVGSKPRLAFALLLYTGQRRSDVVRMGRQHVRDGVIEVRQVKTGARLQLPIHPDLAALLSTETDRLTFLMTAEGDGAKPYTANGFYMRFSGWCVEAGLPRGLSPHGLRKAAARRMAEAGCTAHQIAAVTGHRTLAEVQRYTRAVDQAKLAEAGIARIGRPK